MTKNFIKASLAAALAFVVIAAPVSAAPLTTIYDATPTPLPPSVQSLGFEATSTSEVADKVQLAGTNRELANVTVTMVTWAKYAEYANNTTYSANQDSWSHDVTLNIYGTNLDGNGVPTTVLATKTQSVTIPWRPADDVSCTDTSQWKAADGQCYSGFAFNVTFDLSSEDVTLPNEVIVGVAYDTQSYGKSPLNVAGPYNSLNVGLPKNQVVSTGTDQNNNAVFWDSTYDGRTPGLYEDSGWAPNGTVALKINVKSLQDKCKQNGWQTLVLNGKSFKNQGQCIAYVQSNENSKLHKTVVLENVRF